MTKKYAPILTVLLLACGSVSSAAADQPGLELAERYGISNWVQIQQLEYTFNVELPNGKAVTRTWWWNVGANEVHLKQPTQNPVYPNGYQSIEVTDQQYAKFINDSYWLLFPFQLVWSDPTVTEELVPEFPIALPARQHIPTYAVRKITCQWPDEGGYTPGDAYDLYLDEQGLIKQWVFRRGGQPEGNAHTWEDHQQLGPIIVSLDHHGPEGSGFRLWFTDIKATLVDGTVVTSQPIVEP